MSDKTVRLEDHDGWLLSFTTSEKRAYLDVRMFLVAVGRLQLGNCCQANLPVEEMHRLFPVFVKATDGQAFIYS